MHDKGDTVVSTKNIGGVLRPNVPKGTKGVVVRASGFTQQARVLFTIEGFMGRKKIEVDVTDDEIA